VTVTQAEIDAARDRYDDDRLGPIVERMRANANRLESLNRNRGPLDLACELNPTTVRTPALELLSYEMERAIVTPDSRIVISISPQEGKSTLLQRAVVRALQHDPGTRIALASYAADLARRNSAAVYDLVKSYGTGAVEPDTGEPMPDLLGIGVPRKGKAAQSNWRLHRAEGGVYSVGIGGGLTGRPVDLAFIDDPVKDRREADSEVMRERAHGWYTSVLRTRLAPGASIILVLTRWHEDDLAGRLLADNTEGWREIAIPAQALAEDPTAQPPIGPDPLGRPPGMWMISARGRTVADWQATMRALGGGRDWNALYQQRPVPPEGGLFRRQWLDRHRITGDPPEVRRAIVVIDPSDNTGDGDEAGIIVGGTTVDGTPVLLDDQSGRMTVAQWYRTALLAALRWQAASIAFERSLSGLKRRLRDEWRAIRRECRALLAAGAVDGFIPEPALDDLVEQMTEPEDGPEDVAAIRARLLELVPHLDAILALPEAGIPTRQVIARGTKEYRAELITGEFERGRVRIVGHLYDLEHQMLTWQPGQSSPDRLDAMTHCVNLLIESSPAKAHRTGGGGVPTRSTAPSGITRSTGGGR
jgi:hypothetical protein